MDRFGEIWTDHPRVIDANWRAEARDDDVLLVVGDLSWAMTFDEAAEDIAWIDALPGTKVVIKGNHDFWWKSISKVRAAFGPTVHALQYDHVVIGGVAIVGTRGWQCPGSSGSADAIQAAEQAGAPSYSDADRKLYEREVGRLKLALEKLEKSGDAYDEVIVILHYPPMNPDQEPSGFTDLLDAFGPTHLVHGHLHSAEWIATAFEGKRAETTYHCVSADAVAMSPRLILDKG